MPESTHQLIHQLQIQTRSAAGLPAYNQDDPTLTTPPSLSATIASLNHHTQPDFLRCDNCKGKFLRHIQSNTCVYCGKYRLNDVVPAPICFVSTTGYRWLLRYLGLDGSEMVKPPINKTKREQGKRSPAAEIHLSDFLNVKVTWEAVTNKKETTVSDERAEASIRTFSLTGFAPDDFFFKFNKDASITSSEQPIIHDQIPHDNQDLFQTFHSSDLAGDSLKDKNTEPLSEWQADFQFADSINQHDSSNQHGVSSSSDNFMGVSIDPTNKVQDSEPLNSFPGFSDLNSDELGNTLSSKDENKSDGPNDLYTSVNFFDDFEWQTSNTYAPENITVGEEHKTIQDSFNDWDDFIGSGSLQDSSQNVGNGSTEEAPIPDDFEWQTSNTYAPENITVGEQHKTIQDSFNDWDDFIGSGSLQDSAQNVGNGSSEETPIPEKKSAEMDMFNWSS